MRAIVGDDSVLSEIGWYASDLTALPATAEAVVLPGSAEEVAQVVAWCYERDVPITPRMLLSHESSISEDYIGLFLLIGPGDASESLTDFVKSYVVPGGAPC